MFPKSSLSVQSYLSDFCPHLTGLPDPQRLECDVQHPGHSWDCSGLPEPGAVRPRSVRPRPGGESVVSVQLRSVRRRRAELRRERTCTDHPKDSGCGADRDLQMDSGHWELSQDADGPDSAPGERASCPLLIQLPTLDTVQTFPKDSPRRHVNLQCAPGRTRRQNHPAGPDGAVQTRFGPEDGVPIIISSLVWSRLIANHSVVAQVPAVLTCICFTNLFTTFLSMFKLLMFLCVCENRLQLSLCSSQTEVLGFRAAAERNACSPHEQKVSLQGGLGWLKHTRSASVKWATTSAYWTHPEFSLLKSSSHQKDFPITRLSFSFLVFKTNMQLQTASDGSHQFAVIHTRFTGDSLVSCTNKTHPRLTWVGFAVFHFSHCLMSCSEVS